MFLNQQHKTQILESSDLQALLKAISNSNELLTESEIAIVSNIENIIKEDTKLVLSEEAKLEYYQFLEKVFILDDSLTEKAVNFMNWIKTIFEPKMNKEKFDYFNNKYGSITKDVVRTTNNVIKSDNSKDISLYKVFLRDVIKELKSDKEKLMKDYGLSEESFENMIKKNEECLAKL